MTNHTSFRSILRSRLIAGLTLVAGFAVTAAVLSTFVAPSFPVRPDSFPSSPTVADRLVKRHDCWTGGEARASLPGHAVVTWPGDKVPSYGGQHAVGAALEHVFDGARPGLAVHAFCP